MPTVARPYLKSKLRPLFLLMAGVIVAHGIWGPQFAPKNLSTLLVWVHYRGLLVFGTLLFGNLLCAGCPLVYVRDIGRLWIQPRKRWPRVFRNKWISIALFAAALFSYEYFALWAAPFATAILVLAFFAAILAVDLTFQEASFCKYICPVGQFNFLASMLSPLTVAIKDPLTCRNCKTHDCIKGNSRQRGCELRLFVPRKNDNMDCTFCMDCQRACPADNITVARRIPGAGFVDDAFHPGTGKLWSRFDFNALVLVFVFGAIFNSFAMVAPSHDFAIWVLSLVSLPPEHHDLAGLSVIFLAVFVVTPTLLLSASTAISRSLALPADFPRKIISQRLISALVPVGFGIWAAHYTFHFLTGVLTFLPLVCAWFSTPAAGLGFWTSVPLGIPLAIVKPVQIGLLFLGCIGSFNAIQTLARQIAGPARQWRMALPWHLTVLLIALFSIWIFSLPMDMRGTFLGG